MNTTTSLSIPEFTLINKLTEENKYLSNKNIQLFEENKDLKEKIK